jgi:UrcA family protein
MKTLLNIVKIIGLGAAISSVALPTQADPQTGPGRETRAVSVAYGDLNLSNPAGVKTLYSRLEMAVDEVCAPKADMHNMVMFRDWQQCIKTALDDAVRDMNLPALARIHFDETGRSVTEAPRVADTH